MHEYFSFVESMEPYLDKVLIQDARDVEYGQWELPFEALLLELMKLSGHKVSVDLALIEELAKQADIFECGVLDVDTWERFLDWSQSLAD